MTTNNLPPTVLKPSLRSPLDAYAMKEFGKPAFALEGDEATQLTDKILEMADADVRYWEPRNSRMMESQVFWELGSRVYESETKVWMSLRKEREAELSQTSENIQLNDGYLIVDKLTAMCAGAHWGLDVPAADPAHDKVAQAMEDLLKWAEDCLNRKHASSLHSTLIRDEVHYAALRGWITGLVVPNPDDPYFPWTHVLEDPLFVYPRYSGDRLIRVIHRYSLSVLEAQSDFPDAMEFLIDKKEEDEVEITSYYDDTYKATILSQGAVTTTTGKGAPTRNKSNASYVVVQPLVMHGYADVYGNPKNPWNIIAPRGSPTRRYSKGRTTLDKDNAVAYIGLDVLYPIKDIIRMLERVLSMQFTEIAKGVNPPRLIFYDGTNKPYELDLGIGAENYYVLGREDAKILESSTMKPDATAFLAALGERLQKGSVPSVLYGQSGFQLAGYAINLLTQGAQDVVNALLEGVRVYRQNRLEQMLEMYVNFGANFSEPLVFPSLNRDNNVVYTRMGQIDPADIRTNGVHVNVTYDTILPRDSVPLLSAAIGAVQAGILPLYDAMKDWAGIKDPNQALQRLAEGLNYKDPLVQKHLARLAAQQSGNDLLKAAVAEADLEQQQMMQQQLAQMVQKAGGVPGANSANTGTAASPPAETSPVEAVTNQLANVSAEVNAGSGATPPGPASEFLRSGKPNG